MAAGAGAGMVAGAMMGRGHNGPPPVYDSSYASGEDRRSPPAAGQIAQRNPSPAPQPHESIGQAIEMDERTGSAGPGQYGLHDSDGDVAGIVALQQGRSSPMRGASGGTNPMSPTSIYSDQ